jgi:DNA-binding MarR family transcriptional regulator
MTGLNDIIHQAVRLKIMAALNVLGHDGVLEFTRLKNLVGTTDGNLGAHLETLEKAGYVAIEKRFVGKKPQTRVRPTPAGRRAFAEHVAYLREIIDAGGAPP